MTENSEIDFEHGVALYNALFRRFIALMTARKFARSLVMDGRHHFVDFSMASYMHRELPRWSEWKRLQEWISQHSQTELIPYYILRQFSVLANEFRLTDIAPIFQQRQSCPELTLDNLNAERFADVVLRGHSFGTVNEDMEKLILIQGLKIKTPIQLGEIGELVPLDGRYIHTIKRVALSETEAHLYCGLRTTNSDMFSRSAMAAFMAALRIYNCGRRGDIKYAGYLDTLTSITGVRSYSAGSQTRFYEEETALFGSRPPRLSMMGHPSRIRLPRHFSEVFEALKANQFAAEMLNRALLAPEHLLIPLIFNALEALFVIETSTKKYHIAALAAYATDGSQATADFLVTFYELRNALVHGDQEEQTRLRTKLRENRESYKIPATKNEEEHLRDVVLEVFRKLMLRGWSPKESTAALTREIFKLDTNLRIVLQKGLPKKKKARKCKG